MEKEQLLSPVYAFVNVQTFYTNLRLETLSKIQPNIWHKFTLESIIENPAKHLKIKRALDWT